MLLTACFELQPVNGANLGAVKLNAERYPRLDLRGFGAGRKKTWKTNNVSKMERIFLLLAGKQKKLRCRGLIQHRCNFFFNSNCFG